MTTRKSNLLPLIGVLVAVGVVAFLVWNFFLQPWFEYDRQLAVLDGQIAEKHLEIAKIRKDQAALGRFALISLPADPYTAQLEYDRFLLTLVSRHGFKLQSSGLRFAGTSQQAATMQKVQFSNKKSDPVYTALLFKLDAQVTLDKLSQMLKEFAETPLLHRVKAMTLKPVDPENKKKDNYLLHVQIDFEALILDGANQRPETLVGPDERLMQINALAMMAGRPGGLPLVPWLVGPAGPVEQAKAAHAKANRDYAQIARDNIFIGFLPKVKPEPKPPEPPYEIVGPPRPPPEPPPPPPLYDMREFYRLTLIAKSEDYDEARLFSPALNKSIKLRLPPDDYYGDLIEIYSDELETKTLLKAKVVKIDYGAVYFQERNKVYCIRWNQNMLEAVNSPIPEAELIKLGLKTPKVIGAEVSEGPD